MPVPGCREWSFLPRTCDHRSMTTSTPVAPQAAGQLKPAAPRLLRDPANRVLGGVAAGLARHLGAPVIAIRIAFFALALTDGLGAILYAVFWAVLPTDPNGGRRNTRQLVPFVALALGIGLLYFVVGGPPRVSTVI